MTRGVGMRSPGWAGTWVALGLLVVAHPAFAQGQAPPAPLETHPQDVRTPDAVVADTSVVPLDSIPAFLLLERRRDDARRAILERGRTASGPEATLWLELYSVVEEVTVESGSQAALALLDPAPSQGAERVAALLREEADEAPAEDRPPLLAFAALLLQREDPESAAAMWERILEESPDSPRAVEATLYAARHRAGPGADRDGAVAMLEEMIVAAPGHPLAAEARRLLVQIRGAEG